VLGQCLNDAYVSAFRLATTDLVAIFIFKAGDGTRSVRARSKAGKRYAAFVTALGRRLALGPTLRQEFSEDIDHTNNAG
jgi:hypothetical protein